MKQILASIALITLAACTTAPANVEITEVAPDALPASVDEAIAAERPDFKAAEVLKKVRDGRTYYDVEGETADGMEIEFDILIRGDTAEIVEIQRDLSWEDLPEDVRVLTLETTGGIQPVRIIESIQTDGAVIYELFAEGHPSDPAHEIRSHAGQLEVLEERWQH